MNSIALEVTAVAFICKAAVIDTRRWKMDFYNWKIKLNAFNFAFNSVTLDPLTLQYEVHPQGRAPRHSVCANGELNQ